MKASNRRVFALALATSVFTAQAVAASWQDSLTRAATELSTATSGTHSAGLSLSSLASLLNGGHQALSSDSMTNAAGVMQYCAKSKLTSLTSTENIKNQMLDRLGLNTPAKQTDKEDYNQGLLGLLNTGKGQQLDLNSIGSSPLAEKVKSKACDLVLKQAVNYVT